MPQSTVSVRRRPLHAILAPIPIVLLVATLITDIVYSQTVAMQWANMSAWFLVVALIVSVILVPAGIIDFVRDPRSHALPAAWIHFFGNIAVLVLSIFNCLVHTRDAYTSVVPSGLALSATVVLILLITGWNGWRLVHRHGVGVRQVEPR